MFCPDRLATGVLAVSSSESCLVGTGAVASRAVGSILSVDEWERAMDVPPPPLLWESEVRRGELVLTGERELLALLAREVVTPNRGVVSPEFESEVDKEDEPGVIVDERDRTGVIGSCIPVECEWG